METTSSATSLGSLAFATGKLIGAADSDLSSARMWSGLHFLLALCLYDGLLTLVEVNHGALLAEVTRTPGDRARANMWSAICAAVGSLTSWAAHIAWDPEDLGNFRALCLAVAMGCTLVFWASAAGMEGGMRIKGAAGRGSNAESKQAGVAAAAGAVAPSVQDDHPPPVAATGAGAGEATRALGGGPNPIAQQPTVVVFARQLLGHRNFLLFALVSIIQVFDCTFEKHFFAPFMDALAAGGVSASARGAVVSASFLLPHAATVLVTPWIRSNGLHWVLSRIFRLRLVLLGGALLATALASGGLLHWATAGEREDASLDVGSSPVAGGPAGAGSWSGLATSWDWMGMGRVARAVALPPPWAVCAFMLLNRVTSECVCRLSPLILSDLVDEDVFLNNRPQQLSASIVGTAAFASKFSQSLAPMLGYFALSLAREQGVGEPGVPMDLEVEGEGVTLGMGVGSTGGDGNHGQMVGGAGGPGAIGEDAQRALGEGAGQGMDRTHHSMVFSDPATGHASAGAALHAHAAHGFRGDGTDGAGADADAGVVGVGVLLSGDAGAASAVRVTIWALLLLVPVACVLVQTVVWEGYTLKGGYLKEVKGGADGEQDEKNDGAD